MSKQTALLIAEKPSLMREIKAVYDKSPADFDYIIDFKAQAGHLVELIDPIEINEEYKSWDISLLPIVPEEEGGWKYKVIKRAKDLYKDIKNAIQSGKYDVIIHAGDPDKEGELLVNLVLNKIGNTLPVLRFWCNALTEKELYTALKNLKSDDEPLYRNLYAAALVRQHSDWRFGMNGSRAIADRIYAGPGNKIAAGRVMTWVQTIIVDREDEINNFEPKTVYGVEALFNNGLIGQMFNERTNEEGNKEQEVIYFDTMQEAQNVIDTLPGEGTVLSFTKTKETKNAPKLYNLAALQVDAAKIGFSASDTLATVQSLYEKKYLSYPRTDCSVLSSNEQFDEMLSATTCISGFEDVAKYAKGEVARIKGTKKYVNDKELAKHGHSALVPTTEKPVFASLTESEQKIYELVCKRFLAIFLPPLIQEKIVVIESIGSELFKSTGKTIIDKGFTAFLGQNIEEIAVPEVQKGDVLPIADYRISEKTSTCPKRFTDGTLIATMENPAKYLSDKSIKEDLKKFTIGTSATRDAIIEKLIKNKYIKREKGTLSPTEFGSFMIHAIRGISLCQIDTTGNWERMLLRIQDGELDIKEAETYMREQVQELIADIQGINKVSFTNEGFYREPVMVCPNCGEQIMEGPKNIFCKGYKNGCKYSLMKKYMGATITTEDAKTLFTGGIIEKKVTKNDKSASWNQRLAFDAEAGKISFVQAETKPIGISCPECSDELHKQGAKILCPDCGFNVWTVIAKKELSNNTLEELFTSHKTRDKVKGFTSKAGKKFDAKLIMQKATDDAAKHNKYVISFDFS